MIFSNFRFSRTNGGGSAGNSCLRAGIEVIDRNSAAERQLHVRVGIDATGQNEAIGRINHPNTARNNKLATWPNELYDSYEIRANTRLFDLFAAKQ